MTAITLRQVTKRFGRTTAVDAVDLTIPDGELFFLLGPSGCGKTTLLRMIAGFVDTTAGEIWFGDRNVSMVPPNQRNTGMVFQSYALWPHLTVQQNVAYGLNVRRVAGTERDKRVRKALETVRMEDYAARKPNELSGGQQQRVALARALVVEPDVLLLDEPLSNLDAKLRLEMRTEIKRICSETKITTVYVTHDQKEALSMADEVAVLDHGRVMQVGPPRELYDRPGCRFVADFLGETNFIPGTVGGDDGRGVILDTPAGELVSTAGLDGSPRGGNVTCSIRPEALVMCDGPAPVNAMSGSCVQSVYLGEVAQYVVRVGEDLTVKLLDLNPTRHIETGQDVHLTIDPDQVVMLTD